MDNVTKTKIQQILNAFETGSAQGNYGKISVFNDASGNRKQYTIGRSQTTESGNLKKLLQRYVDNKGKYANEMKRFVNMITPHSGNGPYTKTIHPNAEFEALIRKAALDPIMIKTQDEFFDEVYWNPAYKFFKDNGFTLPLSMLVIYDTAIHSGPALNSPRSMMTILRKRFPTLPPARGGDEKEWIRNYANARHSWLANHPTRPILKKTIYRTNTFFDLINANNWNLTGTIRTRNGVTIRDSVTPNIPPVLPPPPPPPPIIIQENPPQKKNFFSWLKSLFKS